MTGRYGCHGTSRRCGFQSMGRLAVGRDWVPAEGPADVLRRAVHCCGEGSDGCDAGSDVIVEHRDVDVVNLGAEVDPFSSAHRWGSQTAADDVPLPWSYAFTASIATASQPLSTRRGLPAAEPSCGSESPCTQRHLVRSRRSPNERESADRLCCGSKVEVSACVEEPSGAAGKGADAGADHVPVRRLEELPPRQVLAPGRVVDVRCGRCEVAGEFAELTQDRGGLRGCPSMVGLSLLPMPAITSGSGASRWVPARAAVSPKASDRWSVSGSAPPATLNGTAQFVQSSGGMWSAVHSGVRRESRASGSRRRPRRLVHRTLLALRYQSRDVASRGGPDRRRGGRGLGIAVDARPVAEEGRGAPGPRALCPRSEGRANVSRRMMCRTFSSGSNMSAKAAAMSAPIANAFFGGAVPIRAVSSKRPCSWEGRAWRARR